MTATASAPTPAPRKLDPDSLDGRWAVLIFQLQIELSDSAALRLIAPLASQPAPAFARLAAAMALARGCHRGLYLPMSLRALAGKAPAAHPSLALSAQERLSVAVEILRATPAAGSPEEAPKPIDLRHRETLLSAIDQLSGEELNQPVAVLEELTLLEGVLHTLRPASWALPDLARLGMSLSGAAGRGSAFLATGPFPLKPLPSSLSEALIGAQTPAPLAVAPSPIARALTRVFNHFYPVSSKEDVKALLINATDLMERGWPLNGAGDSGRANPMMALFSCPYPPDYLMPVFQNETSQLFFSFQKHGADWRERDNCGLTPLHLAAREDRCEWWAHVKGIDAGWQERDPVGETPFARLVSSSGPSAAFAWAKKHLEELFRSFFDEEKKWRQPSSLTRELTACEASFAAWIDSQDPSFNQLTAGCFLETQKAKGFAETEATALPPGAKPLQAALDFLAAWDSQSARCGINGSYQSANAEQRASASAEAPALLALAGAALSALGDFKPPEEAPINGHLSIYLALPDSEPIVRAGALASLALRARQALDWGKQERRAAWGWENRAPWPDKFAEAAKWIEELLNKIEAMKPADATPEALDLARRWAQLAKEGFNNAPLCLINGLAGTGEPRPAPPEPSWPLYTPESLEAFKKEAKGPMGEAPSVKEFLAAAKSQGEAHRVRPLALAQRLLDGLPELRQDFPHFAEVIDHLEDHCALQMAGDGSFYIPPMLLVGGPGVGKTFFFTKVAEMVRTAYTVLHMESMTASWIITGTNSQWSEARPGAVFNNVCGGETANPILLLDEIDKIGGDQRYNPETALLPLLEPHTALAFKDECAPIKLDTRRVCWVATANEIGQVSGPLKSRLDVFQVRSPNAFERQALCGGVYRAILANNSWGATLRPTLEPASLAAAAELQGPGATRDLRRVLTTACAKAVKAGRDHLIPSDMPSGDRKPRALWDATLSTGS